jgi:hypothetical protein
MESTQEKPQRLETKSVSPTYTQRSPVVQKKLDETNVALAKLSQEDLDLLFSRGKRKEQ